MLSDQRSWISVFNAIGLHERFREISQVRIDCVAKKDGLLCKLIFHHAMMGGGAICKSGNLGILFFESVSISTVAPVSLVASLLLHARE